MSFIYLCTLCCSVVSRSLSASSMSKQGQLSPCCFILHWPLPRLCWKRVDSKAFLTLLRDPIVSNSMNTNQVHDEVALLNISLDNFFNGLSIISHSTELAGDWRPCTRQLLLSTQECSEKGHAQFLLSIYVVASCFEPVSLLQVRSRIWLSKIKHVCIYCKPTETHSMLIEPVKINAHCSASTRRPQMAVGEN